MSGAPGRCGHLVAVHHHSRRGAAHLRAAGDHRPPRLERLVHRTVQRGAGDGIDPREPAFAIRDAMVMTPPRTRTEAYREAARLRNQASTHVDCGAPSGSIRYNSMRILRMEMAGTYRRSVTDLYVTFSEDRACTEGLDWLLSNHHEGTDKCTGNAAGSPYKAEADLPQRIRTARAGSSPGSCRMRSSSGCSPVEICAGTALPGFNGGSR